MVRVLYIYSGLSRVDLEKKIEASEAPDTVFFGFRSLAKVARIEADYIELKKNIYGFGGGFIRRFSFLRALYVFLKFYKKIASYDVVVITSSAYFDLLFFRHLGFFGSQRWFILNLDLSIAFKKRARNVLAKNILSFKISAADKIICISQAQKRDLLELGLPEEKVVFIPLGVDKTFYKPISPKPEFILTIGRDVGRDTKSFLEAMRLLGEPAVMICSPHNVEGLEDKIPHNLTVLFDQPYSVLRSYYERAKVFVIATKPADHLVGSDCPGQTAVLDTLAYGMPMVATEMPWFEGYFESGRHLLITAPNNPKALSEAIKKITSDVDLQKKLGKEGRKLIEEKCNSEAMGQAIARLVLDNTL